MKSNEEVDIIASVLEALVADEMEAIALSTSRSEFIERLGALIHPDGLRKVVGMLTSPSFATDFVAKLVKGIREYAELDPAKYGWIKPCDRAINFLRDESLEKLMWVKDGRYDRL
jgi:hypothetical protein